MREMREIPACLNRRYQALDALIRDLSAQDTGLDIAGQSCCTDPGVRLMCDFWNILKDSPDCDLPGEVQRRMCSDIEPRPLRKYGNFHQEYMCMMAETPTDKNASKDSACAATGAARACCSPEALASFASNRDAAPLSKALCNLKEAASYDKQCNARLKDLLLTEKKLQEQIQVLEQREKDGAQMLKQADCMWACMEESYKKKIEEYFNRQKDLLVQLKEVERSTAKWKKNKKDLEAQITNIYKCQDEIKVKINQKSNDIKFMNNEIVDFKKRIETNDKDIASSQNSFAKKKTVSDDKITEMGNKMRSLQTALREESNRKKEKEDEGTVLIKEARDELQKICRVLLQKKLENEDLNIEKEALIEEINVLKDTCVLCKEKCKNKTVSLTEQIKKVTEEINAYKLKCIYCHECTDTDDNKKFCTDCPKCLAERDCIIDEDNVCTPDPNMDCVCQAVKYKFLDNIFDNMYTVLDKQIKEKPGKAVAEAILQCLRKSKNGKLNEETRNILQDFILTTVKKNLNLTIVGGAVKTRCEMDPETYSQLMTCLKKVEITKTLKSDAGTAAKKDSCRRWGGPSECNCPKGPKDCICGKKAPPPPGKPGTCPENKDDATAGYKIACPHRDKAKCGADCGMRRPEDLVGKEVSNWRPDPCKGPTCNFQNMRAAQCILGPEPLTSRANKHLTPIIPKILKDELLCDCGPLGTCRKDKNVSPRQNMIAEVMGNILDVPTTVSPIDKVTLSGCKCSQSNRERKILYVDTSKYINSPYNADSSYVAEDKNIPLKRCLTRTLSKDEIVNSHKSEGNVEESKSASQNKGEIKVIYQHTEDDSFDSVMISKSSGWYRTGNVCKIGGSSEFIINSRDLNDTVAQLLKDIIAVDGPSKTDENHLVEWMPIDSLIKKVVSLTKFSASDETVNDVTQNQRVMKDIPEMDTEQDKADKTSKNYTSGEKIVDNMNIQDDENNRSKTNSKIKTCAEKCECQINKNVIQENQIACLYHMYEKMMRFKSNIENNDQITEKSIRNIVDKMKEYDDIYKLIKKTPAFNQTRVRFTKTNKKKKHGISSSNRKVHK